MWFRRLVYRRVRLRELWISMLMILGFYVIVSLQLFQLKSSYPTTQRQAFSVNGESNENSSLTSSPEAALSLSHRKLVHIWKQVQFDWKRVNSIKSICLWSFAHSNHLSIYADVFRRQKLQVYLNSNSKDCDRWLWLDQAESSQLAFALPPHISINRIESIAQLFASRATFCTIISGAYRKHVELNVLPRFSTGCFLLPDQLTHFREVAIALGPEVQWLLRRANHRLAAADEMLQLLGSNLIAHHHHVQPSVSKHWNSGANSVPVAKRQTRQLKTSTTGDGTKVSMKSKQETNSGSRAAAAVTYGGQTFAIELVEQRAGSVLRHSRGIKAVELIRKLDLSQYEKHRVNESIVFLQRNKSDAKRKDGPQRQGHGDRGGRLDGQANEQRNGNEDGDGNNGPEDTKMNRKWKQADTAPSVQDNNVWPNIRLPQVMHAFNQRGKLLLRQMEQMWTDNNQLVGSSINANGMSKMIVERLVSRQLQVNSHLIQLHVPLLFARINPLQAFRFSDPIVLFRKVSTSNQTFNGSSVNKGRNHNGGTHWTNGDDDDHNEDHNEDHNDDHDDDPDGDGNEFASTGDHRFAMESFAGKFWTLDELFDYVKQVFGNKSFDTMVHNFELTLNRFALISEFLAMTDVRIQTMLHEQEPEVIKRPDHVQSYQLIDVELICDQQFRFYVTDVTLEANCFDRIANLVSTFGPFYKHTWKIWQQNLLNSIGHLIHSKRTPAQVSSRFKRSGRNWTNSNANANAKPNAKHKSKSNGKRKRSVRTNKLFDTIKSEHGLRLTGALDQALRQHELGMIGFNCEISHRACLGERDVWDLAASMQQQVRSGHFWQSVYPCAKHEAPQRQLVNALNRVWSEQSGPFDANAYKTALIHSLRTHLQAEIEVLKAEMRLYQTWPANDQSKETKDQNWTDQLIPIDTLADGSPAQDSGLVSAEDKDDKWNAINQSNASISIGSKHDVSNVSNCTHDAEMDIILIHLSTDDGHTTRFRAQNRLDHFHWQIPFDTLSAEVNVSVARCDCYVQFEQLQGTRLQFKVNLGIGTNHMHVQMHCWHRHTLVHNETQVNLIVTRLPVESTSNFGPNLNFEVCEQLQSCDFKVYPNERCGLKWLAKMPPGKHHFDTFIKRMQNDNRMPLCRGQGESGRWLIRCNACSDAGTCDVQNRVWLPYACKFQSFDTYQLNQCLQNSRVWFLGDSTNRGMMHSLIQQLNGSLSSAEKTHSMKLYRKLGELASTDVAFAYYPQFWLHDQSPNLEQVLEQMIRTEKQSDLPSKRIFLVVGGVQWMSTSHLDQIQHVLNAYNLTNVSIVIKTLGAGFHQRIQGVHYLPLFVQQKLAQHNQKLAQQSVQRNFGVIDTFNMTNFAYKEFYPGKCSCHFHQLERINQDEFHVKGPVNRAYTDWLINVMCNQSPRPL